MPARSRTERQKESSNHTINLARRLNPVCQHFPFVIDTFQFLLVHHRCHCSWTKQTIFQTCKQGCTPPCFTSPLPACIRTVYCSRGGSTQTRASPERLQSTSSVVDMPPGHHQLEVHWTLWCKRPSERFFLMQSLGIGIEKKPLALLVLQPGSRPTPLTEMKKKSKGI